MAIPPTWSTDWTSPTRRRATTSSIRWGCRSIGACPRPPGNENGPRRAGLKRKERARYQGRLRSTSFDHRAGRQPHDGEEEGIDRERLEGRRDMGHAGHLAELQEEEDRIEEGGSCQRSQRGRRQFFLSPRRHGERKSTEASQSRQ